MCCITFDLSVILKDDPTKQYYLCILGEPVIRVSYDLSSNLEANVEI